jgi:hypothetical protein
LPPGRRQRGGGLACLALAAPSAFVVRTGEREPLFVLADPVEARPTPPIQG